MFDKILSRIGIGAARVDTILTQDEVVRGEMLRGEVRMYGGKAAQEINKIDLELLTLYQQQTRAGSPSYNHSLRHLSLAGSFVLAAGEEKVLPFELLTPIQTPISQGPAKVWLQTDLDLPFAVDPKDTDPLRVLPEHATKQLLEALQTLGYRHAEHSGCLLTMEPDSDLAFMQAFDLRSDQAGKPAHLQLLVQANSYDIDVRLDPSPDRPAPEDGKSLIRFRIRQDQLFGAEDLEKYLN